MAEPYLTLVGDAEHDEEFEPLPFYPWVERPITVPLEVEECATAIHLAQGVLPDAADLLKVALYKLNRMVINHPRLQRVWQESSTLLAHRASAEYARALDSPNDRRREWGASRILSSRVAQSHPFAPAPAQPNSASIALTQTPTQRTITFRFRTDADPDPDDAA